MKNTLIISFMAVVFMTSCASEQRKAQKEILSMEKELFNEEAGLLSADQTNNILDAYMDYADQYPDDTMSAEFLFRASDISMNMGNFALSLNLLSRIQKDYPEYSKVSQCLFLQGFVWENYIGNTEKAREIYNRFLELYPDHDFADDVKLSLDNLGKTPEELIRMFEENAQSEQ